MSKWENFTTGRIAGFSCDPEKNQSIYWDGKTPGLGLRVTRSGAKSFIFQTNLQGKTIRLTIGDVRTWTIGKAQEEATRLKTSTDQGLDPREVKREKIEAIAVAIAAQSASEQEARARREYTLRALFTAYTLALKSRGKVRSAAAAASAFKCHVIDVHPDIVDLPASEVNSYQIAAMIRKVRESGKERSAGVLRSYLSAAYNAAKRAPFDASLPENLIPFAIRFNPVEAIPAIAVNPGNRTLTADELRTYIAHLGKELPDQALRLALLSGGQRMAQLLRAKIEDFDVHTQILRLWDSKGKRKTDREHLLPLAPNAASLVSDLVKLAKTKNSTWLFSSQGKIMMTFTTPGNRVAEISSVMKGEPFGLRDIRRTVETMLAGMGISKDIRAQLLSHGLSGVQNTNYDRHAYMDEKRAALNAWEQRLTKITEG